MTTITLHGELAKKFGAHHSFLIRKPIDAIRALMANKKGFKKAFKTWGRKGKLYEIVCDGKKISTEQELARSTRIEHIDIAPIIVGTSNTAKMIIGTILMVISFYWDPSGTTAMAIDSALLGAGISLFIGGIMGMLFPPPTPSFNAEASQRSFIFNTLENAAQQGASVPLGYGRLRIGTKVISTLIEPQRMGGADIAGYDRYGEDELARPYKKPNSKIRPQ